MEGPGAGVVLVPLQDEIFPCADNLDVAARGVGRVDDGAVPAGVEGTLGKDEHVVAVHVHSVVRELVGVAGREVVMRG